MGLSTRRREGRVTAAARNLWGKQHRWMPHHRSATVHNNETQASARCDATTKVEAISQGKRDAVPYSHASETTGSNRTVFFPVRFAPYTKKGAAARAGGTVSLVARSAIPLERCAGGAEKLRRRR